jgi:hypothetical protein
MSLCFVSNKESTIYLSDLARRLQAMGERIVWLSPSRRWTNWLVSEGWPRSDILCLPDYADEWRNLSIDEAMASLADIEDEAPSTISNVIQMCRNLKEQPPAFAYAYLAVARRHIEPFLNEREVEVAYGEATWGFETLIWLLCRRRGIPLLKPEATRIPGGRLYFCDPWTSGLFTFAEATADDYKWATEFLDGWLNRPAQPDYMRKQTGGYKIFHKKWLGELATGIFQPELDRHDATLWPLWRRIVDRCRRAANAITCKHLASYSGDIANERFVLFPLHHQPETSVDVYGALNSNQMALIETLSRLLPATHRLWVKEHRSAAGDRSLFWYRRLRRLPNVRLVDPHLDIFALMARTDLVVTISGTAAYEAALMGVPAVALSAIYFSDLLVNRPTARSHPLEWRVTELLAAGRKRDDPDASRRRAVKFLAELYANSFEGKPVDAALADRGSPGYQDSEFAAFVRLLSSLRSRVSQRELQVT